MNNSDCVFGYFRVLIPPQQFLNKKNNRNSIGYVCIQLKRPPKGSMGEQEYVASFAFCSPLDSFNKKLARIITSSRMNSFLKTNSADYEASGRSNHNPTFSFKFDRTPATKLNDVFKYALAQAFYKSKQSRGRWNKNGLQMNEIPFCPEWLLNNRSSKILFGLHD